MRSLIAWRRRKIRSHFSSSSTRRGSASADGSSPTADSGFGQDSSTLSPDGCPCRPTVPRIRASSMITGLISYLTFSFSFPIEGCGPGRSPPGVRDRVCGARGSRGNDPPSRRGRFCPDRVVEGTDRRRRQAGHDHVGSGPEGPFPADGIQAAHGRGGRDQRFRQEQAGQGHQP